MQMGGVIVCGLSRHHVVVLACDGGDDWHAATMKHLPNGRTNLKDKPSVGAGYGCNRLGQVVLLVTDRVRVIGVEGTAVSTLPSPAIRISKTSADDEARQLPASCSATPSAKVEPLLTAVA